MALHSSTLKRLSEEAARNPKKEHIHVIYLVSFVFIFITAFDRLNKSACFPFVLKVQIKKLKDEIKRKNEQITLLEKHIADSIISSHDRIDNVEASQVSFRLLAS